MQQRAIVNVGKRMPCRLYATLRYLMTSCHFNVVGCEETNVDAAEIFHIRCLQSSRGCVVVNACETCMVLLVSFRSIEHYRGKRKTVEF